MSVDGLLDLFFPPTCVACDEVLPAAGFFCEPCELSVTVTPAVQCRHCGEPGQFAESRCPRCTQERPSFEKALAPFEHEGAVASAIHRYKYGSRAELSKPLASLLARTLGASVDSLPGTLCPLPLHDGRYKERGYDQATLLALGVSKVLGRPFNDAWLTRERATTRQVGLSEQEREANVRGAFKASPTVLGQAVVLIDDVLTTGATAREAARALLDAGARQVCVLTLARARRESLA